MKDLKEIVEPLIRWFRENKRDLPWRQTKDPYAVWVSEIMLQQTRVEAVKPYYIRFLQTLPTVKDLANADEEVILKLWEGLGYYSRVRNMQKAAIQIMEDFGRRVSCKSKGFAFAQGHWALYGRSGRLDCVWSADSCGRWECSACNVAHYSRCIGYFLTNNKKRMGKPSCRNHAAGVCWGFESGIDGAWRNGLSAERRAEVQRMSCSGELHGILQKSDSSVSRKGGEKTAYIRISERIFLRRWGENCDWQTPEKWLAFGTLGAAERTERHRAAYYIAENGHFRG